MVITLINVSGKGEQKNAVERRFAVLQPVLQYPAPSLHLLKPPIVSVMLLHTTFLCALACDASTTAELLAPQLRISVLRQDIAVGSYVLYG